MAQGKLPLPDVQRTKVFRVIDQILRSDPTLKGIFTNPGSFRSWRGGAAEAATFANVQAPAIRLTPLGAGEDSWYSPESQEGELLVRVELKVPGTNSDDVSNLWGAIQRAIYPKGAASIQTTANLLVAAGSQTGMVVFLDPAYDASAVEKSGYFDAVGALRVDLFMILNP